MSLKSDIPIVSTTTLPYLEIALAIDLVIYAFEFYLDCRQYRKFREAEIPEALKGIVNEE